MNIQDYISSGILETYLLGLAGEEEARELEQLCLKYPEVKAALEEAESMMENYAQLHAIAPPAPAKEQIWSAIQQSATVDSQVEKPSPLPAKRFKLSHYITAAAILVIVAGVPYHIYKMNKYEREISILEEEKQQILVENKNFQARIKQASDELELLSSADTKSIKLAGVAGHEAQQANLFLTNKGGLFINATHLETLPDNQQYQLWAIVKGKPVSAGLINQQGDSVLQKMINIKNAELYAITIEKQGGSVEPTLSQMVVAGKP
ncbi:anti-sigma factor [Pedobacter sp.]|uniref:anti-sigma factor n=1 Tax=Pedobacter sp. TaxID=1411316 RepID=UPI003D7F880D